MRLITFSEALEQLKRGHRVYRTGWNAVKMGSKVYIQIQIFHDLKVLVYHSENDVWQWHPSILDMLSEDWVLYE